MDFKSAYRRFKQWQLNPFDYEFSSQATHHCRNCGNDFVGNYCPYCSQNEAVGRITWKSVAKSIAEVWGMNNRSLLYSVVQLFFRPGYFISDYISGKRQVSFPPVKMLAIIALLGIGVDYATGAIDGVIAMTVPEDKRLYLDDLLIWMDRHPDFLSMILFSFLIIPVYFVFRLAPQNTHHTLPQGFFIQVFSSVVFLFVNMLYDITGLSWLPFVLGALMMFYTYKQLFGYGVWGTSWRVVTVVICGMLLLLTSLGIDYVLYLYRNNVPNDFKGVVLLTPAAILLSAALMWIGYTISKHTCPKTSTVEEE